MKSGQETTCEKSLTGEKNCVSGQVEDSEKLGKWRAGIRGWKTEDQLIGK